MTNPSFRENDASQVPALLLLQAMGYTYLSPEEATRLRGNDPVTRHSGQVLLEPVLRDQLRKLNSFSLKGEEYTFSEVSLTNAIYALLDYPVQQGYLEANRYVFDLLTLGKSFEEQIGPDKKSFSLHYIDWENPERNVWHVTEELRVSRTGHTQSAGRDYSYRPDIVLYVNGIPLVVIECKRPDMDKPLSQAISQHLRNQQSDGIRPLYILSQLLLAICGSEGRYATNQTKEDFWQLWRERENDEKALPLQTVKDRSRNNRAFGQALRTNSDRRDQQEPTDSTTTWTVTPQDELLYALCRPSRLLNILYNFIVFDAGEKIVARYQQYFGVRRTLERVRREPDITGKRQGGVIWHTQGSGKSYTMVMLAQLLATDDKILNPKIVLVTDRVELDDQIYQTFKRCGREVVQATTGRRLVEYLEDESDAVLATLVHKFDAAIKGLQHPITRPNVFVLIDEAHRTQYGSLNVKMQQVFPTACFIGFTGTPLMRREKNTANKFGGIIDTYTVRDAVADGAVVPLLFEGRAPLFEVNERPIDNYFNRIAEPLNDYQRADLKKKFSRRDTLTQGEQIIYAKAWDISTHFANNWKGTGFKGQLVAPGKKAAVRFKRFMDEIGLITTEVLISPPDDREGNEDAYGQTSSEVQTFWNQMMDRFGSPKQYDETLRQLFKQSDTAPDVIIVVNKLLTGFDNPINVVLYLCAKLHEHTLFQAITRVNRKAPGKDFGYIIDYDGVIAELARVLEIYADHFEDFETADLEGTMTDMLRELARLPQVHSEVWDVFKGVTNRHDLPAYQNLLADEAVREIFFERLSVFSRLLKMAFSNHEFVTTIPEAKQQRYRDDLVFFQNLRRTVINIHALEVDYSQYEPQIQKLIDTHVVSDEIVQLTEQVNIFDRERFEEEVARIEGTASRAHAIAARTDRTLTERMGEDPAFYRRFSEMIRETLMLYREERISETELLKSMISIRDQVVNRPVDSLPPTVRDRPTATAIYGLLRDGLGNNGENGAVSTLDAETVGDWSVRAEEVLLSNLVQDECVVVDWANRSEIVNQLRFALDDWVWQLDDELSTHLTFDQADELIGKIVQLAKARY